MLTGAHVVVYSKNADVDRAFFKDVLGLRSVDAGQGWLIFAVPAAEVAFHPHDENNKHELYFLCDDIKAQVAILKKRGAQISEISQQQWGTLVTVSLPGGGGVKLYQPKHPVTFDKNLKVRE